MKLIQKITYLILLITIHNISWCQNEGTLEVVLRNKKTQTPVIDVKVAVRGRLAIKQSQSDSLGTVKFILPAGNYSIEIEDYRFNPEKQNVLVEPQKLARVAIALTESGFSLNVIDVVDSTKRVSKAKRDDPFSQLAPLESRQISMMPGPSQSIERLVTLLGGVGTTSEFSTQYRVRGGNFDENLIYINDVEIYRPQIVRTGQQEGLSITNSNLADDVTFSTGGFQARYADKLSSVLNIKYKNPTDFEGSAEVGLLTINAHVEGSTAPQDADRSRFTYLVGGRRFSTTYLLNSLETQGDYRPNFWDAQGLFSWTPKPKKYSDPEYRIRKDGSTDTIFFPRERFKISALGILTRSKFLFYPQNRETTFGTFNQAFRLFVAFIGEEQTNYTTGQGALIIEHNPSFRLNIKHILSTVISEESELTTVEGGYRLADVNTSLGSDKFNEVIAIRGIGTELRNARNFLNVQVLNIEQKGEWKLDRDFYKKLNNPDYQAAHKIHWGLRFQTENIRDQFKEWTARDSAGYLDMDELVIANHTQRSFRLMAYLQETWKMNSMVTLITGVRAHYWNLTEQTLISPRLQLAIDPSKKDSLGETKRNFLFRIAVGYYAQPAFYRELRDYQGRLFQNTRAQESIHYIAGFDYIFKAWGRQFKLFFESYYKQMLRIIPYEIDNVRIRYYPQQSGIAYAYGMDARVNGQFIKDIDSWFSLSWLRTQEDVTGDVKGFVRRPSDQRVIATLYFQDNLPNNPTVKVHVNLVYNSGLPFGPPTNYNNRTYFQATSYQRVDIGISKLISFKTDFERKSKFSVRSIWIGLEVFNLLQRGNVISYTWIEDVYDTRFAVPNYLSARLFNLRMIVRI